MTEHNNIIVALFLTFVFPKRAQTCKLCLLFLLQLRIYLTFCSFHRKEQNVCLVSTIALTKVVQYNITQPPCTD